MVESIRKRGLVLGKFPLIGDGHYTFIQGLQWLTDDPNPAAQSWATSILIPYDRTEYRLTVNVPMNRTRRLHKAKVFAKKLSEAQREIVEAWAGSEHWYIYEGSISPKWITMIERTQGGKKHAKNRIYL
jgi:hypothetical protein